MILWFRRLKRFFTDDESKGESESSGDLVEMVDELLRDMDSELADMQGSLNKQIASEKRLKRRIELMQKDSLQREQDAIQFLEMNDDQSARRALLKKEEADRGIEEMVSLYESAQVHKQELLRHIDEHRLDYKRLQKKKSELQSKRNLHPSSSVHEMEIAKDHVLPQNDLEEVRFDKGQSLKSTVDEKLAELKQSLKKRK
ncbi:hypothetical protein CR194_14040 [Salipaludibacillus keqinensis]|uniref:Phage shock protein A n=1 Tax=Salipaludibacillus keqinensis TaxID=2045207 RepID=A0A323TCL1_9BACI|nr:PspA/IM30 family protein [Salipaludibacillus keqinensis]PYZ92769.1 hypothetical protein CR194_14040 [Salipaludibacillus keqinensis]